MRVEDCDIEGTMAHAQRQAIEAALRAQAYNMSRAARHLRIGRTTLYRLVEQYAVPLDGETRRFHVATARSTGRSPPPRVTLVDGNWYLVDSAPRGVDGLR